MEYDVPKLLIRLQQLQAENAYLKHLLDQAGISYSTPPQIHSTEITKQLARRFFLISGVVRMFTASEASINLQVRLGIILNVKTCGRWVSAPRRTAKR